MDFKVDEEYFEIFRKHAFVFKSIRKYKISEIKSVIFDMRGRSIHGGLSLLLQVTTNDGKFSKVKFNTLIEEDFQGLVSVLSEIVGEEKVEVWRPTIIEMPEQDS
jgi:hypothetical protein